MSADGSEFDAIAEEYDRYRESYPDALVDAACTPSSRRPRSTPQQFTAEEFLDRARTTSSYLRLDSARRAHLEDGFRRAIERAGGVARYADWAVLVTAIRSVGGSAMMRGWSSRRESSNCSRPGKRKAAPSRRPSVC